MLTRMSEFEGTWRLLSRIDRATDGNVRDEPSLGSDPIAMITYATGHFSAQFMKRDRATAKTMPASSNNTGTVGGYDAYFGTYRIRDDGLVEHRLIAALTPQNVGMVVIRRLGTRDGQLVIELDTTTASGEPVMRTLTWDRIA
ncbi:lipocalin-like domain-containing protein [Mesorhizobium sp. B2-4-19]|nr:lipocalin-like domain-containing protein [Mesorhizobium sp. B2-4-19]